MGLKSKYIAGFGKKYIIYSNGKIYNTLKHKYIKQSMDSEGFLQVALYYKEKRYRKYLHRLIAEYFIYNKKLPNYCIVNHIDNNKLNNNLSNLFWMIYRQYDVNVFAFGLLKDFRNRLFEGTKKWIEEADSLREVKTICEKCNRKATCNALENDDHVMVRDTCKKNNDNVVIGDSAFHVYCQLHWHKKYNHDVKLY